jgi:hypothetical protein
LLDVYSKRTISIGDDTSIAEVEVPGLAKHFELWNKDTVNGDTVIRTVTYRDGVITIGAALKRPNGG